MGPWDALFGERVTLDLPLADGTTKKVSVTKKWLEEMVKQGKMKDVSESIVNVNIRDSGPHMPVGSTDPDEIMNALVAGGTRITIEHWQVGVQVSRQQCDAFLDPESREFYALRRQEVGGSETVLLQRSVWDSLHAMYDP